MSGAQSLVMRVIELFAFASALFLLGVLLRIRWNFARLPRLPLGGPIEDFPSVCLCIPARNEGREIGAALDSWLAQDVPLFVVAVDDDSTDDTPALLAERAKAHPERLRVLTNRELPPGWLGKNHALHLASCQPEAVAAEWILFSDADVNVSPDLLRRVFGFLKTNPDTDLMALMFSLDAEGIVEELLRYSIVTAFLALVPSHQVPNPAHWSFCAGGAFILVRRSAYDAIGGHAAAPLEAIDDMMMARRVKRSGRVNRVALGAPMVHLRMYHGLFEVVKGLRKSFAGAPLWGLLPLFALFNAAIQLAPLGLALTGHSLLGALLLAALPLLASPVMRSFTGRALEPAWFLWPLLGLLYGWAMLWAFLDRLRGRNSWRGRTVNLRKEAGSVAG